MALIASSSSNLISKSEVQEIFNTYPEFAAEAWDALWHVLGAHEENPEIYEKNIHDCKFLFSLKYRIEECMVEQELGLCIYPDKTIKNYRKVLKGETIGRQARKRLVEKNLAKQVKGRFDKEYHKERYEDIMGCVQDLINGGELNTLYAEPSSLSKSFLLTTLSILPIQLLCRLAIIITTSPFLYLGII